MKISAIIPFHNDHETIGSVISNLTQELSPDNLEVIIVVDGGNPLKNLFSFPNIIIIDNKQNVGVGYSWDRGVEKSSGDILVIMASDVYPRKSWYEKVCNAVSLNPNTFGCATCIGLNPTRMNLDDPKNFRRYGADLLFYMDTDDLPKNSVLRTREGGYTSLFKAKWLFEKQSDEPYEIPCILGAFYFTTKEYYQKIHGFDTFPNSRQQGHRYWGHAEPYISLKSWLHGGGCILYPDIEAGHVFARVDKFNRWDGGLRSADWMWWNALFILETMILDERLRKRLYDFVIPELNFNVAKQWIRNHYPMVERIRERNRHEFKYDHTIFTTKFGYSFEI